MNINELKSKLQSLNRRTNKPQDLWKPRDEHDVRLLRYPGSDDPLVERAFHYNVGDVGNILCPKANYGEPCDICAFGETLRAWKDEKGREKPEKARKEDFEIFKKIQAVTKVFTPMVERAQDGSLSDPKWWGLTGNQATQVLKVCSDADRLRECGIEPDDAERAVDAVFSPAKAFDLHVSFKKPGEKGNTKTFTQVDIEPKYKPSALTGNRERDEEIVAKIKPIDEVFERATSDQATAALKKFIGGGMKVAEPEGGKEYGKNSGEDAKAPNKGAKKAGKSIDDAFNELSAKA